MKQKIKSNKVLNFILVAVALVGVVFGSGFLVSNVYAGDAGGVQKKWAWALYHQCIQDGKYFPTIESKSNGNKILDEVFDKNGTYYLPSYKYGHTSSKASLNCRENMEGASGWSGAMQGNSSTTWKDPSGAKSLLNGLEYNLDESSQEAYFTIQATEYIRYQNIGIGLSGEWGEWHENEASTVVVTITPNDSGGKTYKYSDSVGNFFNDMSIKFENHNMTLKVDSNWVTTLAGNICTVPSGQSETFALKNDPQEFRNDVNSVMTNRTWTVNCTMSSGYTSTNTERRYNFSASTVNMAGGGSYKFRANDNQATTRYTYANLVSQQYGGATLKNMNLTDTERYNLYLHYLQSTVPAGVQNRLTTSPTDKTNLTKVRLKAEDGEFKDFYANYNGSSPSSFSVYTLNDYYFNADSSKHYPKVVSITMADVISWFNSVDTSKLGEVDLTADEGGPTPDPTPTPDPDDGEIVENATDVLEEACYKNAKSLGWIICPIIFGLREVTENIYKSIEPLIRVSDPIVGQVGDNQGDLYKGWSTFRGFANVLFAIFFLIVIFSQLTGYGIDNYGIKKMLPKLIITAILVNLSFFICAIAVDISNIVGSGIKNLFEQLGGTMALKNSGMTASDSVTAQSHIVGEVLSFLAVGGAAAGVGFALEGWAIIIPILLFLLVMLISIIFALIILGLRQAFVVILIVLAPIAFACNVLPNTEGIFKKWFNVFKGILVVYPIVGGLIGAGYFAGALLYGDTTADSFIMTIVAGLLTVIPYFMIPSLTRKSLDAIGGLGTKLGNMGSRVGNGARNRINNTDAVRHAKADSAAQRAQSRAARYMKSDRARKVEEDIKNGKKVSMRRANKYSRAANLASSGNQAKISARQAQSQYNRMTSDTGYNAAMAAASAAEFDTEVGNYEKLIATGNYGLTDGSGGKIDTNDNAALQGELERELLKTGQNVDGAKIRALQNQLAKNGKEGRNAMFNAMANAQSKAGSAGVDKEAVKNFSSNILNNHAGTMKDKHRSLYEFAKATAVDGVGTQTDKQGNIKRDSSGNPITKSNITDYVTGGIQSMTSGDITGADTQQLARYIDEKSITRDKDGNITGASWSGAMAGDDNASNRAQLAKLATEALSDEHLAQSLSGKQRDALESIVYANGGKPPVRKDGLQGRSENFHNPASPEAEFRQMRDNGDAKLPDPGNNQPKPQPQQQQKPQPNPNPIINPNTGRPFEA